MERRIEGKFVKNGEILLVDRHILVMKLLEIQSDVKTFNRHKNIKYVELKIQKLIDEANK